MRARRENKGVFPQSKEKVITGEFSSRTHPTLDTGGFLINSLIMIEYSKHSHSLPQKTFLVVLEIFIIFLSWQIIRTGEADPVHKLILLTSNILIFLFYLPTILVFVRRGISWMEAMNISLAFGLYFLGFPYLGRNTRFSHVDFVGLFIIISGLLIHFVSELQRHKFKKIHPGRLMTNGLWSLSRHINYFGDLVWVTGFAILTRNPISFIIPVILFIFFYFFNIPLLEKHLANRYGEEFERYKNSTKSLIPYII